MYKRIAARSALVLALVVPSIAVLASPAMAFTKDTGCTTAPGGGAGQWIAFRADNGTLVGRITWFWAWQGQDSRYQLAIENREDDGASISARVDFGSSVGEYSANKKFGATVVKYRAVWNGHASSWYPANYCNPDIAP